MNKPGKPDVAEIGGICVLFGFLVPVMLYVGIETFVFSNNNFLFIFACICSILMIGLIGLLDDILGWKRGFSRWQKPLFTIPAVLPMVVLNAGHSTMILPIIGSINWGLAYPLIIIPIGIIVAANGYNMLAGYNGLEAGLGIIILSTLGAVTFLNGKTDAALLSLCMVGALSAFLYYNWYPAKIFPGNMFTYMVGALIACVAILGDVEKIAVILFIPFALDFFLPLRKRFNVEAYAKVNDDNSLDLPYDGIYDTTHLAIALLKKVKRKVFEPDIVLLIYGFEGIFVVIAGILYI